LPVSIPYVVQSNFLGKLNGQLEVFKAQKKPRIMEAAKKTVSCRELFKKFDLLPLTSKFLLPLLSLIVDNMVKFEMYSDVHSTRQHMLNATHTRYQKVV
jgi:hypothetical protein